MVQAQAKVQEGPVRWESHVNSWDLCRRPDTGQGCPRAACKQLDVPCPFPRQSQAENCDSREDACDSGGSRDKSWTLRRAVESEERPTETPGIPRRLSKWPKAG